MEPMNLAQQPPTEQEKEGIPTQGSGKISFPEQEEVGATGGGFRGPQATEEMLERVRQLDPQLDNPRTRADLVNRSDKHPNEVITGVRNERTQQARVEAANDLLSDALTANAVLYMPTELEDPKDAIHKEYGENLASLAIAETRAGQYIQAQDDDYQYDSHRLMANMTRKASSVRDTATRLMEEYEGNTSWASKGFHMFLQAVPLVDRLAYLNTDMPGGALLSGNKKKEVMDHIWDQENPHELLEEVVRDLDRVSPGTGVEFLKHFQSYTSNDILTSNVFDVVDIGTAVPAKMIASAALGVVKGGPKYSKIAEAMGDNGQAAVADVAEKIKQNMKKIPEGQPVDPMSLVPKADPEALLGTTDELLNADVFLGNSMKPAQRYLLDRMGAGWAQKAMDIISNRGMSNISDDGGEEFARLVQEAKDDFMANDIIKPGDSIGSWGIVEAGRKLPQGGPMGDEVIKGANFADNVDRLGINIYSKGGESFKTPMAAELWANRWLRIEDYRIVPAGSEGYILQALKPLNTADAMKIDVPAQKNGMWNWVYNVLSDARSLSADNVADRRVISDRAAHTEMVMGQFIKEINTAGKKELKEVLRVAEAFQEVKNPKTGTMRNPTTQEFQQEFTRLTGKKMSDAQVRSYEALGRARTLDKALRETTQVGQANKQGFRHYTIGKGNLEFQGRRVKEIPPANVADNYRFAELDESGKVVAKNRTFEGNIGKKSYEDMVEKLKSGEYELVEAMRDGIDIGEEFATHVLIKKGGSKTRDIRFGEMIADRPGWHKIIEGRGMIKQGKIKNGVMRSDTTLFSVDDLKAGEDTVKYLNQARAAHLAGDQTEFARIIDNYLPELNKGMLKKMDWSTPFKMIKGGTRLADDAAYMNEVKKTVPDLYVPSNREGNPMAGFSTRFTGQRDEIPLSAIADGQDGGIAIRPATALDPQEAVLAGLRTAFSDRTYAEYIDKHSQNFLRAYKDHLHPDTIAEFKINPLAAMRNAKFSENAPNWMPKQAERLSRIMDQFVQMPTESSMRLQKYLADVSDTLNRSLPSVIKNSAPFKFVDERVLHTIKDPIAFWRSVAFHSKLGMFNPKQLFLQSAMIGQVAALEGLPTMLSAQRGYMYMTGLALSGDPKHLDRVANLLAKDPTTTWKSAEHFKEAYRAMRGNDIISSNVAVREMQAGPSKGGRLAETLENSTYFFKKGEQMARVTAWNAAYLKWRKRNPTAVFDQAAQRAVRMRASDLTVNMTRDMNASFQRGWMSMGTQFWSFQTRTMEQMIFGGAAGTLTKADRAKIFAYNSAMFGLPVGAASVTGWEWKETARQMLMEHGVEADDNLVEVARDGLLSTAISMMTGTDFDTSNIAPGGLPQFKEIMKMWNGDARDQQSLFELLGGAGATTGAQLAVGVKEGYTTAANLIRYFNGDKDYEPTVEDLMEPLEAVSSLSAARRVIRATRLGEYITGYEEATGLPISGKEALVEMLTGFTKDDRIDYYATKEFLEAQRMETREMKEEAQRLVRLSDQARDAGDPEQAKKYFRRAKTAAYNAGLTGADWLDVFDYVEEANKPSRRTEKSFQQWVAQDRIEEIQRQQEEGAR